MWRRKAGRWEGKVPWEGPAAWRAGGGSKAADAVITAERRPSFPPAERGRSCSPSKTAKRSRFSHTLILLYQTTRVPIPLLAGSGQLSSLLLVGLLLPAKMIRTSF